jgi:hypothetical protein
VAWWLEWWNLVFVVPFAIAVLYYLLLATGALAVDGDGQHDLDADDGLEHAVGPEHPGQLGPLASLDHALTFLGIGRAPLSIVLTTFALTVFLVDYDAARDVFYVLSDERLDELVASR